MSPASRTRARRAATAAEGQTHARGRVGPRGEAFVEGARRPQRPQDGLLRQPPGEGGPPGGERAGVGAAGVHAAGPGEEPVAQGLGDVAGAAGAQQRQQRVEAQFAAGTGGRTQADRLAGGPVDVDDRAACRFDDLNLDRVAAAYRDPLDVVRHGGPAVHLPDLDPPVAAAQPFAVEVLVVGHGVGDGPGDRAGVAEVRHARNAGEGQPGHVEFGAGEADLLVDPRQFEYAVRVAGDHGGPSGARVPRHRPGVAARARRPLHGEEVAGLGAQGGADVGTPQLVREGREEDVLNEEDAERRPGPPRVGSAAGRAELRGAGVRQGVVDAVHVGLDPAPGLREQSLEAAAGGVVQPGPPGETVPGHVCGAQSFGQSALGSPFLGLHLPGAIGDGRRTLRVGQILDGVAPHMWNAPLIPSGGTPPHMILLRLPSPN
ncbi:hypothetical protein GCM10010140_07420 [Streptosporangium pseudovulgare]|uniref:Uncharacterized protein n=1 Tax=Streptosporangium pseudovulgare TaxID=35765 RepID=A0ABQ2QJP3_9ACTN|nr:hypothetical protein GCM10010140_07420 [Streptosporangium pseudovulgare]